MSPPEPAMRMAIAVRMEGNRMALLGKSRKIGALTASFSQSRFEAAPQFLPALFLSFRAALYRDAIFLDQGGPRIMFAACVFECSFGYFHRSLPASADLGCGCLFFITLLFALALLVCECDSSSALCILIDLFYFRGSGLLPRRFASP